MSSLYDREKLLTDQLRQCFINEMIEMCNNELNRFVSEGSKMIEGSHCIDQQRGICAVVLNENIQEYIHVKLPFPLPTLCCYGYILFTYVALYIGSNVA